MILIIAEKPSLARNIVAGIGKMTKRNGYYEGCGYFVTWAFGHLFSLCDIEHYNPLPEGKQYWTMDNLPCFPEKFEFDIRKDKDKRPDSGVVAQFETIKALCRREDVETIVNAGDSDREGEIIVRLCVYNSFAGSLKSVNKRFVRLWLPDQTPETVGRALTEMKEESEYDNLANEGFARTFIDWLYGVNLTRYATLKCGTLLRVGRVIVPIVKAIYDRDMAIRNFVPDIYYALVSKEVTNGAEIELISKNKFDKEKLREAETMCRLYNESEAVVIGKKKKKDVLNPGKLYSLSKLQNVLGKKYKMSMDKSLAIVQKLYEEGFLTYPRTNSEYLATNEQDKIKTIIANVAKLGYPVEFKLKKTIFDDSKIESHSAITPTFRIPDKNKLSEEEYCVYSTVMRRFVAVFCSEECKVEKTEIVIDVGSYEQFTLKGTVIVEPGWTKYDDSTQKDKILPLLEKGDKVNIDFKPTQKETSPPKHYTIETLNNYLKNPFREEKANAQNMENEDDSEEYRAMFEGLELGTEATRTGIIDNAIKSNYIELKKDVYRILPGGEYLIESLVRMGISMDKYKTAEVGKALKAVFRGEMQVDGSVLIARKEIEKVFEPVNTTIDNDTDFGFAGDEVGICPVCGGTVIRTRYGYGCKNYKEGCKFSINLSICNRVISVSNVKELLNNGKTSKIKGFTSKNGKLFDAALKLEAGKAVFDFT